MTKKTTKPEAAKTPPKTAIIDRRIRKVAGRIVTDPAASMEQLASEASLSVSWMQQLFKQQAGEYITSFSLRHRMIRAARLLRTTNLRIKEVAVSVGYSKTAPFDHMFTRMVGQSPGDYRATSESASELTCLDLLDFPRPSAILCSVCNRCKQRPPAGSVE